MLKAFGAGVPKVRLNLDRPHRVNLFSERRWGYQSGDHLRSNFEKPQRVNRLDSFPDTSPGSQRNSLLKVESGVAELLVHQSCTHLVIETRRNYLSQETAREGEASPGC